MGTRGDTFMRLFVSHVSRFLCLCLIASQPAVADWLYTMWDMTPEELVAESGGEAELVDPPKHLASGLVRAAESRHETGAFVFDVAFLFRTGEGPLARIVLHLVDNTHAPQLYATLLSVYGEPDDHEINDIPEGESHIAKWKDPANKNVVTYYGIGDYYAIEYAPLDHDTHDF